jgi:hypothetical protein
MFNFYKVVLKLEMVDPNDPTPNTLNIVIATKDIHRIEPLVESNKMLYNRKAHGTTKGYSVGGFYVTDTLYGHLLPYEKHQEELAFCDIVDEEV